jgi:outer membrane biosynthesis protein TonB
MSALAWRGPSFRDAPLPFAAAPEDVERWRRWVLRCVLPVLALALLLPWLPRPRLERSAPPPPFPVARLLVTPEPEAARPPPPRPPVTAQAATRPAVVVPEARRPVPDRKPGERDERQKAATGVGLLALKQQLAQIHGAPTAVQLQPAAPGPGVGGGQGPGVGAGTEAGLPLRALVTSNSVQGSGGIGTAAFSRDSGGGGLAGRATTLVAGVAGGSGGGGPGGGGHGMPGAQGPAAGGGGGAAAGAGGKSTGSGRASRSIEDIKLVFDRHKGAIHALYNRALREDPALQGKVVLELKIAPSGAVEAIRVLASELHAADLERQLLARVRLFDFGAKDVAPMVVSWPVDFLPS